MRGTIEVIRGFQGSTEGIVQLPVWGQKSEKVRSFERLLQSERRPAY